jgi:ribosome biogenesis GTPase
VRDAALQQEGFSVSLTKLGWNVHFAAMWQAQDKEDGWVAARVVSQQRGLWRIAGDFYARGLVECWAAPSGKMHAAQATHRDWPAVGDWIAAEVPDGNRRATIHGVLPRRSQFVRKTPGKRIEQQVIAANVDTAFLVAALDGDFNLRRLERYLAQCCESGARPVILLNKADECNDFAARAEMTERIAGGTPVLVLSARTRQGIDALDPFLAAGQTVVLLGSSGVGKSTLVNLLLGQDLQSVRPIRENDSKGRHTTTVRQLVLLPSGAMVIDTPGLRELQLWDAADGVSETFADIEALAAGCRFRDCRHVQEPGCAVRAALEAGTLEEARLENRRKLESEQEFLRRKMDPEARAEAHDRIKVVMRGVRQKYRQRDKDGGKR